MSYSLWTSLVFMHPRIGESTKQICPSQGGYLKLLGGYVNFNQKSKPYMRTLFSWVKKSMSSMHPLHTSEVTEIDLYLVISFFNFFLFLIQSDIFYLVQKNPCQNSTCLFQLYHWNLLWSLNFKKQTKRTKKMK